MSVDRDSLPYRPCAGFMLANSDGLVFVGERINTRAHGFWQMPQGGIDPGEDQQTAALRELEEETGLRAGDVTVLAQSARRYEYDLPDEIVPTRWGGRYRGQSQAWFLIRLDAGDGAIDIDVPHPEFSDWRWMTPAGMLEAIVAFKRPVYEAVLAEFADRLGPASDE